MAQPPRQPTLILRDVQIEAFRAAARRAFADALADRFREQEPSAARLDRAELRAFVRAQVDRADGYGLDTERGAALFLIAAWHLGDGFDLRLRAGKRLIFRPGVAAERREAMLEELLAELGVGADGEDEEA